MAFRKKKELDLTQVQPMTGGNQFEVLTNLKVQRDLDINNLYNYDKAKQDALDTIQQLSDEFITSRTIQPYFLLQLQSYYFTNTIRFECNNTKVKDAIFKVIKCAWLYGKAGLWYSRKADEYVAVYCWDIETDIYGNITGAKLGAIDEALRNERGAPNYNDNMITLTKDECKDLYVFRWGVMGLSAWMVVWPFIQFQAMLLQMLVAQSFFYNKKLVYNVNNLNVVKDELKAFYNPVNIFITNLIGDDIGNRFTSLETKGAESNADFINYYKEVVSIYYHILGRKLNVDNKKERNTTTEVNASQENFDVVQSEWINQFKIFAENINESDAKASWAKELYIEVIDDDKRVPDETDQSSSDDIDGGISGDKQSSSVRQ